MENNEITKISVSQNTHSKIATPVKKKPITHTKREKKTKQKNSKCKREYRKKRCSLSWLIHLLPARFFWLTKEGKSLI